MTKSLDVKEKIIEAAIALIQESNGNEAEITTRAVAQRAEVGVGLINYHFQTKENLITICVQRIIGKVVSGFNPRDINNQNPQERMANTAIEVFEFFFINPAISRISILGDFFSPAKDSNTIKSQNSIQHVLGNSMNDNDKKIFSFVLAAAMQSSFLAHTIGEDMFGYGLDSRDKREIFIRKLVDMLFNGANANEKK